MNLLTGLAAVAALAALLPLAAWAVGRRRAEAARRSLDLPAPRRRHLARPLAAAGAVALLGLAAAQPALTHSGRMQERADAQALFVLDISRSMAASARPTSPTRLDRAVAAAVRLRTGIADVPSGIATLTDRTLPNLLPVADRASFDATAQRAIAIENPPPAASNVRATTFSALREIATGDYFAPKTARRLVVLLTDGESGPVDTAALTRALPPARGYRFVAVRFWHGDEAVYDADGKRETAYRPDPLGRVVLQSAASALGGRAFEEAQVGAAGSYLQRAAGSGPTTTTTAATPRRVALAPYLAAIALLLLLFALVPLRDAGRAVQSTVR